MMGEADTAQTMDEPSRIVLSGPESRYRIDVPLGIEYAQHWTQDAPCLAANG